jgi:hypothetical protein
MKWVEDCFARNTCKFTETHWYVFCFLGRSLGHPSRKFSEVLGSISRMKRTVSASVSSATGMELISQDGSLMSTVGVNLSEEETTWRKKN